MEEEKSYYERNKEARKAYQKTYYDANKASILRRKELKTELEPEKAEALREYQRKYYLENRKRLLDMKRKRYLAKSGDAE
jgi:hypothetical protein